MNATYIPSANNTTGGTSLNSAGSLAELKKLWIGSPIASANIYVYNDTNPGGTTNTSGLLAKFTLPSSFATGQLPFEINLEDKNGLGLQLPMGGNIIIDQALQLTAQWSTSDEGTQQN